jgi:hypothetical protein
MSKPRLAQMGTTHALCEQSPKGGLRSDSEQATPAQMGITHALCERSPKGGLRSDSEQATPAQMEGERR